MGFWHTGYAEFHEVRGLEDYVYSPPPPTRYECTYCTEYFLDIEELRRHRFERHPIRQPALWLRGRNIGTLRQLLLTPLQVIDVAVEDTMRCLLNNQSIEPQQLGQHLAKITQGVVELELSGKGASTHCILDFRIATKEDLEGVDAAFLRLARTSILNTEAITHFIQDCHAFSSAMPYCNGICTYLYGVMAKERSPDSGLSQEKYIERYMRASEELSDFNRLLARSIRALIAFHFNHFQDAVALAPQGSLRHAAQSFTNILQGQSWHFKTAPSSHNAVENSLTDQDTLEILADASHSLDDLKNRADALLNHQKHTALGSYDHTKRTLLACEALAMRDDAKSIDTARKLARVLNGQNITSQWAKAMLTKLPIPSTIPI